jgi:hypothetical protein
VTGTIGTVKYNSSGVQQWVRPGNMSDIKLDQSANIYVTGETGTAKYSTDGMLLWTSPQGGLRMVLDASGNVLLIRVGIVSNSIDYIVTKLNNSGAFQWSENYNGTGNGADTAKSIAVDLSGNVYVTGQSLGINGKFDYVTVKYNTSGVQQWVQRYIDPANVSISAKAIAVDLSGNVYVTGNRESYPPPAARITIKYNTNGIQQWIVSDIAPPGFAKISNTVTIDNSQDVYVDGIAEGMTIVKYNPLGDHLWSRVYNRFYTTYEVNAMCTDIFNNVYQAGTFFIGSHQYNGYIILKYESDGDTVWSYQFTGIPDYRAELLGIATDNSANVYVTGYTSSGTHKVYTTVKLSQLVGVNQKGSNVPDNFSLHQNYPNPFNPATKITYDIPSTGYVKLIIYDVMGREVKTLVNEKQNAGSFEVEFDGSSYPSGVYFYKLQIASNGLPTVYEDTKRMVLLK